MPPVLTMSSGNYDYDYDAVQPYFLLDGEEEDFYLPPCNQLLPGPGEDIWKKFELLPTPPLSPSRSPSLPDVPLSAAEHLAAVSSLLDEDRDPSAAFLQSFIIQDCMWSSSFAAATKLEKAVTERLASLRARRDSSKAADEQVGGGCQVTSGYLQDLHTAATDCVDPSAVFPYATPSERGADGAAMEVASELCLDSPPLSSSDSESEEEEEEEEEEGGEEEEEECEEEEEVDVVTVDRQNVSRRSAPLVLKRSHINIQQHNYAAQQPAGKRIRSERERPAPRQSGGRRCCSPRADGEGDTVDRRRTHNVLERQRRSELKMSFFALRDEIPATANNDKAAKVVILKRATEFVCELREDERKLLRVKDELRKRSRELTHRLQQLRTTH